MSSSVSPRIGSCVFFQAEDGIRDGHVTGVQTCALPISPFRETPGASADSNFLLVGKVQIRRKSKLNRNAREDVDLAISKAQTTAGFRGDNLTEGISQLPCQSR